MTRLIDTMAEVELSSKVLDLLTGSTCLEKGWKRTDDLKQGLEALFAPAPHWTDNLDVSDSSTWVLCYLSDDSPEETWHVDWVGSVTDDWYVSVEYKNDCDCWKYATPIDLNVRFKKEMIDD